MKDLTQAKTALANLTSGDEYSLDDLKNLLADVDVDNASGNITVLYSGDIVDVTASDIATSEIATEMISNPNIRVIDKTHAADFMVSEEFRTALAETFGKSEAEIDSLPRDHPLKSWLFDGETGAWAATSKRFVEATTGEVRIMTVTPRAESVL